jgi:hypothetical protein
MEKKQNKRLVKVKLGEEKRYIEEGDTLEQFKDNFKKEFNIISNENDFTLSCLDKANRITKIEDEKTYQKLINIIIDNPKLIEPSFIPKKKIIHKNSKCSECGISPIEGIKYQCLRCELYELCFNCEKKFGEKHGHPLLKLRKTEFLEKYKIFETNDEEDEEIL